VAVTTVETTVDWEMWERDMATDPPVGHWVLQGDDVALCGERVIGVPADHLPLCADCEQIAREYGLDL
jgi:hypothetical protein